MANRSNVSSNFAALAPPWVLSTLDADLNALNGTLNDSSLGFINTGTDTGTANAYNIPTLAFGTFSSYNQGSTFALVPANTNTGASTITIGILGSAPIVDIYGNALIAGALLTGCVHVLVYSGTSFRVLRSGGFITYTASNTPINGTWGVVTGWTVLTGSSPLVTLATNTFTFNTNCLAVLNGSSTNANTIQIALSSRTGVVTPAGVTSAARSPSGAGGNAPMTFYGTPTSSFQVSSEGVVPSPPTVTYYLTFFPV